MQANAVPACEIRRKQACFTLFPPIFCRFCPIYPLVRFYGAARSVPPSVAFRAEKSAKRKGEGGRGNAAPAFVTELSLPQSAGSFFKAGYR